jgi:hypothetical protein
MVAPTFSSTSPLQIGKASICAGALFWFAPLQTQTHAKPLRAGRMAALDTKLDRKAEFLAVDLQFLFYGFDVVPNLSNRIGYFFF